MQTERIKFNNKKKTKDFLILTNCNSKFRIDVIYNNSKSMMGIILYK